MTYATQWALGGLRRLYRFTSVLPEDATLKFVNAVAVGRSVLYYCYPENGNRISSTDAIFRIQTYRVLVLTLIESQCLAKSHVSRGAGGGSLSVVVD